MHLKALVLIIVVLLLNISRIFEGCNGKSTGGGAYLPVMHFNLRKARLRACSPFHKYSNSLAIGIGARNCSLSITRVIKTLKLCRYSTDALKIVVYPDDDFSKSDLNYMANFTTVTCKCLLSEHGSLFINRGVTFRVNSEMEIEMDVANFCNMTENWASFSESLKTRLEFNHSLIERTLYLGNRFSFKGWEFLKDMDKVLKEISQVSGAPAKSVGISIDVQQFVSSTVCKILHKSCERNSAVNRQLQRPSLPTGSGKWSGGIGLILKRDIQIAVYEYPIHNAPWEVEFSPALFYDHLLFAVSKRWTVSDERTFARSFSSGLWMTLLGMLITIVISLMSLDHFSRKLMPSKKEPLSIFKISYMLMLALLEQPQKIAKRVDVYILMGCCGIVLANLATAYKSKLFGNLMTLKPEILPSTSNELFNSDYRININLRSGMPEAIIAIGEGKLSEFERRSESNKSNSLSCLAYTLIGKYACVSLYHISKLDATKLLSILNITDPIWNIFRFSPRDFGIYSAWAFRRGFPFKEKINDALGRILQSGLQQKWYSGLISYVKYDRSITAVLNRNPIHIFSQMSKLSDQEIAVAKLISFLENYKKQRANLDSDHIKMLHIMPLIYGLCFLIIVAFVIFVCERLVGNQVEKLTTQAKYNKYY